MKTPLVLLPGMMCDARLFGPQVAGLSDLCDMHVLPVTHADTMQDLAAAVLEAAPERFALGGLSMGGIVAMEVIRQAPDRVMAAAFLDTNPRAELPEVAEIRGPQIEKVRGGGLRDIMLTEMKPRYLADPGSGRHILDLCMDMAESLGPDVFIRQSLALRDRPDQQDTLRAMRVPTLALCGAQDQLCPIERHELICDLVPGAHLEIIENAGHLTTLEQPEHTNAALRRWLEAI